MHFIKGVSRVGNLLDYLYGELKVVRLLLKLEGGMYV